MQSGKHYLISPDGSYRWDLTVTPIQIGAHVTQALMADASILSRNMGSIKERTNGDFGKTSLLVKNNTSSWCVEVSRLHLRTNYRLLDGIHVPNFGGDDPELDLVWEPIMPVWFMVDLTRTNDADCIQITRQWLFAEGNSKMTWRLPLPNTYADCHLCHGLVSVNYNTQGAAVIAACEQLQRSLWNSDLSPSLAESQRMFRWKPTETGFEQLPPALNGSEDWTCLCTKVGVEHLTEVL